MNDQKRVGNLDDLAGAAGNEIAFGNHTIAWYRWAAWYSQQIFESRCQTQLTSGQQAFAILCKGDELGMQPFTAWTWIYQTKAGRLAIMSKGALAVVQSKPTFAGYEERIENEGTEEMRAVAVATRRGFPPTIKEFSLKDAEVAGLLRERRTRDGQAYDSTYQSYLKDMLLSRARGRVLDIAFAAELGGIPIEGIAEDADRMEARRRPEPAQHVAPPRRDPLFAALPSKHVAQLAPGSEPTTFSDLTRNSNQTLDGKLHPGVPLVPKETMPKTEVAFVNRDGTVAGKIVDLKAPEPEELDPSVVKVIGEQVDEMFPSSAPPATEVVQTAEGVAFVTPKPGGPPAAAQPGPGKPAEKVPGKASVSVGRRAAGPGPGAGLKPKPLPQGSACPRCKGWINAMGGCDVCGWPGAKDFRDGG